MKLKSARLLFLIVVGYIKRNKIMVALALVILLLAAALAVWGFSRPELTLRIGIIGTYQEHDLPEAVTRLLSSGLAEADKDGRIKPGLLGGWEVNNDATYFKLKLKDGLSWVDNSPVRSSEVSLNIPNTEISYPDDKTILIKLKEPYSPLPSLLTNPIFKKNSLLGTGPYKLVKIEKSRIFITKIILEPPRKDLPRLIIRFYPVEDVARVGFNLGEVQAVFEVGMPAAFAGNLTAVRKKTDYSKIVTLLFQNSDPLFKNRSLRQALAYQLPLIESEKVANNPYPPFLWAYDKNAKKYFANPSEAGAAMERAKSSLSEEQLKSEMVLTSAPNLEEIGKAVVASWKELGFDVKLRVESGLPQNFQALLITQSIPTDPDQYFLWHATQSKTNIGKYDSKRADKDLEDGRKLIKEEDRMAKYLDFQKTLMEDAPAAFLYFPKYNIVYLKKVEGLLNRVLEISGH